MSRNLNCTLDFECLVHLVSSRVYSYCCVFEKLNVNDRPKSDVRARKIIKPSRMLYLGKWSMFLVS